MPLNWTPVFVPTPLVIVAVPSDTTVVPTVSVKLTMPVGWLAAWPETVSATVAIRLATCPLARGDGFTETVVLVLSPTLTPVPLTATTCVLLGIFNVLFVRVMLALERYFVIVPPQGLIPGAVYAYALQ